MSRLTIVHTLSSIIVVEREIPTNNILADTAPRMRKVVLVTIQLIGTSRHGRREEGRVEGRR